LLPALRTLGVAAPRTVARAFNRIAWPAFAVLIGTGVWNVTAVHAEDHGSYRTTLIAKLAVVAVSGLAAWLHTRAQRRAAAAVLGAITGLAALGALFLGVLLSS
jgi:hypothetical protein